MKKVFAMMVFAAAMLFTSYNANAQLSIHAGYLNDIYGGDADNSEGGFYAGASYNVHAFSVFGVAPGAYIASSKDRLDLRVPVLLNYRYDLNGDAGVIGFLGPQVNLGLSGDTYDIAKKLGLGLNLGLGFAYQKFSIELGYMFNFINQYDGPFDADVYFNQLTVGVGFTL